MKIEFKQVSKKMIKIICVKGKEKKEIGHIFTPSTNGKDTKQSIQVCGFSTAYNLWGCGVFADKGKQVKDIQLEFCPTTEPHCLQRIIKHDKIGFEIRNELPCLRCYNHPCTCEVKGKETSPTNPYMVKRERK